MHLDSVLNGPVNRRKRGRLRQYSSGVSLLHKVADAVIIVCALCISCYLHDGQLSLADGLAGGVAAIVFLVIGKAKRIYRSWRTDTIERELLNMLEVWLAVVGIMAISAFFYQNELISRHTTLMWFVLTPLLLSIWRLGVRYSLRFARMRGKDIKTVAIAGSNDLARYVAKTITSQSWMGYRLVGLFDGEAGLPAQEVQSLEKLLQLARNGEIDTVYVVVSNAGHASEVDRLLEKFRDTTASVYLLRDRRSASRSSLDEGAKGTSPAADHAGELLREDMLHGCWVDIGGIMAVSVYETPIHGPYGLIKRVEDIVVSSLALFILAAPMIAISLGVKLSSPGPVFFKQRRYGLDGREISVWKFRSMTVCEDGDNVQQAGKNDMRITKFGAFLRRTSLDELPQFINVFLGTMSVVGPRPHAVAHNEYYRELIGGYMLRHKVKPGITGWAQVNGLRGETSTLDKMSRRVDYDLHYIKHWSVLLDIKIIILTAFYGFVNENAY